MPRIAHGDSTSLQVRAGGLPANAGLLLDAPYRPAQAAQCDDLLSLRFAQDVHPGGEPWLVRFRQTSCRVTTGRFSGVHHWPVLGVHRGSDSAKKGALGRELRSGHWITNHRVSADCCALFAFAPPAPSGWRRCLPAQCVVSDRLVELPLWPGVPAVPTNPPSAIGATVQPSFRKTKACGHQTLPASRSE